LQKLIANNLVLVLGQGKSTRYQLSSTYAVLHPVDMADYFTKEIDEREIKTGFDHSLIKDVLSNTILFTAAELQHLQQLQQNYLSNIDKLTTLNIKKS
jgi:hypothetical protein